MVRVNDQPVPAVTLDAHDLPWWWQGHGQLVVALERLPQAAYVWDDDDPDVTWDDTTPERVWDAPFIGSGFTDVWCDLVQLELVTGEPDDAESYRTPYARLVVRDPGDGRYRARTVDGRLVYWSVGKRLAVWWHDETGADHWLFSGQIATWRDELLTPDVTIEAYGSLGTLAQPLGREWTAGVAGQLLRQRATAILAAGQYTGPLRSDLGDATLRLAEVSDTPPLDELRRAARSDGGIVYADADDTVVVRDRRWRQGRSDQTTVPLLTANVCDAGAVIGWDVTAADLDVRLASVVSIANNATPTPLVATATNPGVPGGLIFTHPTSDLWTTQAEGNALAAHMAANRADARLAVGTFDVYLHDIRFDYWHATLERRLGDRVRFVHEDRFAAPGDVSLYDVTLVVTTLRHTITRDSWVASLATTPAVAYTLVELWDQTQLTYDDPSPLAVWR